MSICLLRSLPAAAPTHLDERASRCSAVRRNRRKGARLRRVRRRVEGLKMRASLLCEYRATVIFEGLNASDEKSCLRLRGGECTAAVLCSNVVSAECASSSGAGPHAGTRYLQATHRD